jgi:flavin reductase (DIM6/NTAB) family NADH-FMN oxidoreductase RutF
VLADHQAPLAELFAGRGGSVGSPFAELDVDFSPGGLPVLRNAIASFDCRIRTVVPVDDHLVIFGRVTALPLRGDAKPLLHWKRSYRELR